MKKAIFTLIVAALICVSAGHVQAEDMSKSEVKAAVKEIHSNIRDIAKAVKAKDRAKVGQLSGSLRKQWYGLPWGVRQAIESSKPG